MSNPTNDCGFILFLLPLGDQLTVFAQSVTMMYVTAFACGFCSAIVLLVSNVYISEIASPDIRGGLSAVAKMASHIGVLMR